MTTSQQKRSISVPAGSESKRNIMNKTRSRQTLTLVYMQNDKSSSVAELKISEQEYICRYETLHLWSNIVGSTTESCSTILSEQVLLAHAEVGDLYVSLMIQHHII